MEYSKALSFIWEDPDWQQKMLVGTGVMIASVLLSFVLIGFLGYLIVMGYCVRLMQNVRKGEPHPLPEWDQWGEDLARGFKLAVVMVVWALPMIILTIPSAIGSAMAGSGSEGAQAFGALLSIVISCFSIIYGLFYAVLSPGITISFAQDEQIMSGLQFREIWAWTQDNIGQVIVVALVYLVASFGISLVALIAGTLLCLIGLLITIPLGALATYLFQYHLFGQLAYAYPFSGGSSSGGSSSGGSSSGGSSSGGSSSGGSYSAGSYSGSEAGVGTTPSSTDVTTTDVPRTDMMSSTEPTDEPMVDDTPSSTDYPGSGIEGGIEGGIEETDSTSDSETAEDDDTNESDDKPKA